MMTAGTCACGSPDTGHCHAQEDSNPKSSPPPTTKSPNSDAEHIEVTTDVDIKFGNVLQRKVDFADQADARVGARTPVDRETGFRTETVKLINEIPWGSCRIGAPKVIQSDTSPFAPQNRNKQMQRQPNLQELYRKMQKDERQIRKTLARSTQGN